MLYLCYRTQVQLLIIQEFDTKIQVLDKGQIALLRKPETLGRRWSHVPKGQLITPHVCLEIIQGKAERAACWGYMSPIFRDNHLDN